MKPGLALQLAILTDYAFNRRATYYYYYDYTAEYFEHPKKLTLDLLHKFQECSFVYRLRSSGDNVTTVVICKHLIEHITILLDLLNCFCCQGTTCLLHKMILYFEESSFIIIFMLEIRFVTAYLGLHTGKSSI